MCSFPKIKLSPGLTAGAFFCPIAISCLTRSKPHVKCVSRHNKERDAQMEEVFFGKYHDTGDYWQVYLDIGEDTAQIQVVLDHDDEQLVRDTIWLPIQMLPALATAINSYFAGTKKLVEVVI